MRKSVLALMTGLTALVVGLGIRTGGSHDTVTAAGAASAGVVAVSPSTSSDGSTSSGSTSAGSTDGSSTSTPAVTPSPTATRSSSQQVNGEAQWTRYGAVQVQITVTSGKVVSATAIQYPTQDRRDQEINSYAIPQLDQEASQSHDGNIDAVSGATVTSMGYIGSLQSALDQARSAGLM